MAKHIWQERPPKKWQKGLPQVAKTQSIAPNFVPPTGWGTQTKVTSPSESQYLHLSDRKEKRKEKKRKTRVYGQQRLRCSMWNNSSLTAVYQVSVNICPLSLASHPPLHQWKVASVSKNHKGTGYGQEKREFRLQSLEIDSHAIKCKIHF